jgi:GlpG protein
MRKIGGDLTKDHALRFADFLLTKGIEAVVEEAGENRFEIWARHEDQLSEARQELQNFLAEPDAEQYRVDRKAETLRRQKEQENRAKLKLQRQFKPQSASPLSGSGRATLVIILLCVIASIATDFAEIGPRVQSLDDLPLRTQLYSNLRLVPLEAYAEEGRNAEATPFKAVFQGQIWRLITPIFLHGSPMHLVFNCLFLFSFGRIVETLYGPLFFVVLFILGGVFGILAQIYGPISLGATPNAIGASGGALALFSFLWLRPNFEPSLPFRVSPLNVILVLGFVVVSMLPIAPIPNVANLAHLGGLVWGAVTATGISDFLRR